VRAEREPGDLHVKTIERHVVERDGAMRRIGAARKRHGACRAG